MFKFIRLIIVLLMGMLLLTGCGGTSSEDAKTPLADSTDSEAPKITISGKSSITIVEGSTYTDAGATAKDNVDGVVTIKSTGSVDSSKVGTYIITYTATDKAGNKATAKRTVKVVKKTVVADILPQKSRQFKKKSNSFQNSQPQALSSTIFSYPSLLTFKLSK